MVKRPITGDFASSISGSNPDRATLTDEQIGLGRDGLQTVDVSLQIQRARAPSFAQRRNRDC